MNDSLDKLYETLLSKGLYTKSLEDFKEQYKGEDYRKKVFDVVSRDGLYTKDFNSFSNKYSVEDKENKEKEEEETTKYKSDIDITEYFSKNPETQKQKDFSYFDKDFDKINEDIGGLFGNLEETVVKDLDENFKKWGFTFEEAEAGSDAIKVISTKDPDINKTFSLDDPNQGMYAIKSFIDKNKRDNAVYAEEIKDIDVSDNYMQDLFKATAENDEEKKNKLLQGISRKIYASEGVSYDEVKNLESRGKTNQNEIDFINNNLLKRKREFDPEIGQMIEFGKESVSEYKASEEEIEKYPNIFDQKGNLKVDPLKYQTKLEKQNERFSDVTASDVIYKVKVKEKLLFDKFKNKESVKIIDQSKEISEKTLTLSSEFKKITGLSIDNFEGVNAGIESNINSLESELKQVAGVGFSGGVVSRCALANGSASAPSFLPPGSDPASARFSLVCVWVGSSELPLVCLASALSASDLLLLCASVSSALASGAVVFPVVGAGSGRAASGFFCGLAASAPGSLVAPAAGSGF